MKYHEAEILVGMTIAKIDRINPDRLEMTMEGGRKFTFLHVQDCCESCAIQQVIGDLAALVGKPLVKATKFEPKEWEDGWPGDTPKPESMPDSFTWTFVTLATDDAKVQVRWLGESNGYYGEGVDLEEIT